MDFNVMEIHKFKIFLKPPNSGELKVVLKASNSMPLLVRNGF